MPRHTSSRPLTPPPLSPLFNATNERLALDASQIEQLQRYVETLGKWQPTLNLIGPKTWADVWNRHVVDSLQCLDPAGLLVGKAMSAADQAPKTLADIGTGAGFPGIVIAIATGLPVTLVESDQRKAAFLLAVKSATGAPLPPLSRALRAPAGGAKLFKSRYSHHETLLILSSLFRYLQESSCLNKCAIQQSIRRVVRKPSRA